MINRLVFSAILASCIGSVIPASANDHAINERRLYLYGTPDGCLVQLPSPVDEDDELRWKGACTNEYASGNGTLTIFDRSGKPKKVYTGEVERGAPTGPWNEPVTANKLQDEVEDTVAGRQLNSPESITAPALYFGNNSSRLGVQAAKQLDEFVHLLNAGEMKYMQISIHGHTSAPGDVNHNARLSLRRAEAVRGYMIGKGIDKARLTASGKGASEPVGPNGTAKESRRVTFVLSPVRP
ncbi:MAG: hypothetical protein CVU25_05690 [Betaproteobacteria bacterium HGW-Betaproteobacteria-19]|nr:MAG: hypothetical protein CVU25_05690 [Betaproteobacteria bacterium HGW-Betaproteobacteria-19]